MKLLIELPTWLGDAIMATPAIENIVNFYNDAEITFIGSFVSIEALKNHPKVIKKLVLDKKYTSLYKISRDLGNFDAFFSFRSSVRSKFLKFLISAKKKHQFDKNKYQDRHQVEKYNDFINDSLATNSAAGKLKIYGHNNIKSKRKVLGINPGASYGSAKRWYPQEFAKVATELSNQYNIVILYFNDLQKFFSNYCSWKKNPNFLNLTLYSDITLIIMYKIRFQYNIDAGSN